jgi:hypothetical protein
MAEPIPQRPLTAWQRQALSIAVYFGVTHSIEGSMPSLAKRGLMVRERRVEGGRSVVYWASTEAGRKLAGQIRSEAQRCALGVAQVASPGAPTLTATGRALSRSVPVTRR